MEVSNKHGGYTFPHSSRMRFNPRRVDLIVRTVDDDDRFGIKEVKGRGCKQDESELMILGMKSPRSMGWSRMEIGSVVSDAIMEPLGLLSCRDLEIKTTKSWKK
jgi:hypothetical protein